MFDCFAWSNLEIRKVTLACLNPVSLYIPVMAITTMVSYKYHTILKMNLNDGIVYLYIKSNSIDIKIISLLQVFLPMLIM